MNALFHKQYPSNVVPVNYYSTIQPYNYRDISSNSYHIPSNPSKTSLPYLSTQSTIYSNQSVLYSNHSAPILSNHFAGSYSITSNYKSSYRGINIIMISSLVLLSLDLIFVRSYKQNK